MAVINKISKLGDILISGQWGDVLFNSYTMDEGFDALSNYTIQNITKSGGVELAKDLWENWKLEGSFENYFCDNIKFLLKKYDLKNNSANYRAFKSEHHAKRWANTNLKIFTDNIDTFFPYYEDEICNFVCNTPEVYLKERRIQIDYIKRKSEDMASIPWQVYDLNLYQFKKFNTLYFPRRVFRFIKRKFDIWFLLKSPLIERNWENQFYGKLNEENLKFWLIKNKLLNEIISEKIVLKYYNKFLNEDPIKYSHPIIMILTLSVWCKLKWKK